jgi:hypothetical protein
MYFSYNNHYNVKLNKCFILVEADSTDTNVELDLFDVLESKRYASYLGYGECNIQLNNAPGMVGNAPVTDKCRLNSGKIWFSGNDSQTPDLSLGFV